MSFAGKIFKYLREHLLISVFKLKTQNGKQQNLKAREFTGGSLLLHAYASHAIITDTLIDEPTDRPTDRWTKGPSKSN